MLDLIHDQQSNGGMSENQFCEKLEMKQMSESQTWENNKLVFTTDGYGYRSLSIYLRLDDCSMQLGSLQKILLSYA